MDCLFGFCYTFLYTENNTNGNNKHFIKKKKKTTCFCRLMTNLMKCCSMRVKCSVLGLNIAKPVMCDLMSSAEIVCNSQCFAVYRL